MCSAHVEVFCVLLVIIVSSFFDSFSSTYEISSLVGGLSKSVYSTIDVFSISFVTSSIIVSISSADAPLSIKSFLITSLIISLTISILPKRTSGLNPKQLTPNLKFGFEKKPPLRPKSPHVP